jgi:biotin transport system substrate-specific component
VTALAHALVARSNSRTTAFADAILVVAGSLLIAGLAQVSIKLPFTPVPVTGQTLGVLLVGGSLGALLGGTSVLLYLVEGAIGLPFFADGRHGFALLGFSSATGGYLWGFLLAAVIIGWLAQKDWDRGIGSSLGAMLIGEILIFTFGVSWLAAALDVPVTKAMELGLYPFVAGDVVKLVLAAGVLPAGWKLTGARRPLK